MDCALRNNSTEVAGLFVNVKDEVSWSVVVVGGRKEGTRGFAGVGV